MKLVPLFYQGSVKAAVAEETTKSGIVLPGQPRRSRSRQRSLQWDQAELLTARK